MWILNDTTKTKSTTRGISLASLLSDMTDEEILSIVNRRGLDILLSRAPTSMRSVISDELKHRKELTNLNKWYIWHPDL